MANHRQDRAHRVVEAFRELLDDHVSQQISQTQYDTLALMISEAIGDELGVAAGMMEEVIKQIRIDYSKSEIGM